MEELLPPPQPEAAGPPPSPSVAPERVEGAQEDEPDAEPVSGLH
jgi:hypothetical protein